MIETKLISSLDKCFIDQTPADFAEVKTLRMFRNERASIQFAAYDPDEEYENCCHLYHVSVRGEMGRYASMHTVESIPNCCPAFGTPKMTEKADPTFLRTTPGLYPDVLADPLRTDCMPVINQQLHVMYIDFEGSDLAAGSYPTTVVLSDDEGRELSARSFLLTVIDADLPAQDTRITHWFYADCLADYYHTEPWSDRHFEICGNFIRRAVENGTNMILMPVFTVALDTHIGGERTTTQLVRVSLDRGEYTFDFGLVDRWIDLCLEMGVRYFEVSHLFSQWGGAHAPKIMATVDGVYRRLFGWDTDASGEPYVTFLRAFLKEFTAYMERRGLKDRTYFHISDEPSGEHLPTYRKNRETVDPYLKGWRILDALSDVGFFREGLLPIPVPSTGVIEDFMKEDIGERWVYYCCGPWIGASNRFVAMHLVRTRSIGMQMYKYGIEGFLHWGFNFYNNCGSYDAVNPFLNPCGGYWGFTGDAFLVYPKQDGTPMDSLRLRAFRQGVDDIRLMKLAEMYYGREAVVKAVESVVGKIDFFNCVNDTARMEEMRRVLEDMILARLG